MRDRLGVVVTVARDPTLARIELAFLGYNMAEYATWVAILVWAYGIGGPATAGLVALVQLIPAGLIAPFAAFAGDRFRRDRVLVAGYLTQALSLGLTSAALIGHAPPLVTLAGATVAATSLTLTRPIHAAILPAITHRPVDLTAANAVSSLAEQLGIFVGPLIGGILLGLGGPGAVFAMFALVSLAGVGLVRRLPIDVDAATPRQPPAAGDVVHMSLAGFGVLVRERRVLLLVAVLAAASVVVGALDILVVAVAIDLVGAGDAGAGFLYAAFGLGGVLGAIASVSLVGRRRLTPSLAGSAILFGGPISAIGVVATNLTAPLLFAASGAGSSIVRVAGNTLLQRAAREDVLARVFGVLEGLAMFALAAGSVGSAAIAASLGIPNALLITGAFVPLVLGLAWLELRVIDRDAPAPDAQALELLLGLPIFGPLSAPSMERILADLVRVDAPATEVLIRQGDEGDRFYVIVEGRVQVTVDGAVVAERGPGDGFGEIALLRGVPRTATVTALTAVRLIALDRASFLEAVTGHPQSRARAEAAAAEHLAHAAPRG
jgi:predicted MFS family arabinose efflux permease